MAQSTLFDFNDLGPFEGSNGIGNYMSDLYGSEIEVDGARATNDNSSPPEGLGQGETDRMIATSFQLLNRGDFEILFTEVPIISASFEGHVLDPTPGVDFSFKAFSGDNLVFEITRNNAEEVFESGVFNFDEPVDRLRFSDSGRHDVGIDDLNVTAVPEPATGLLCIAGLVAMLRRRTPA